MNLNHLAIFHAVAEAQSITGGAARLMVSQPAVSKQLRMLERSLGVVLVDRRPRGIRLTTAGEMLAAYANKIFALETEATAAMEDLRGLRRGRLRIGASTTIGIYLLPDVLMRFRKAVPGVDAVLEVGSTQTIVKQVADGALEAGFVESEARDSACKAACFMTDSLVAIVHPKHPLVCKKRVSAQTFVREPFIVRGDGSDTKSHVERELSARALTVTPVMTLSTNEAVKRAVMAGIGVAIVSHLSIGMELAADALSVLNVVGLKLRRPLYGVTRRTASPNAALLKFYQFIIDSIDQ